MADLPQQTPWLNASLPVIGALHVGDHVVRSGTTSPTVGVIASLARDHAFVEWRDGTSDWSRHASLRGAPPWWC